MSRSRKDADNRPSLTDERLKTFETFRVNLRLLRHSKGLSAAALSKELNFNKQFRVIDLEEGRVSSPKLEEVMEIAKFFEVTIDKLLFHKAEIKF